MNKKLNKEIIYFFLDVAAKESLGGEVRLL